MASKPGASDEAVRVRASAIASSVTAALADNRMRFHFQPIVSAETETPVLYECLLSMVLPGGTIVSAGEFITVAEQCGLYRAVDRHTLELAAGLLKKHAALHLSLNISSLSTADMAWLAVLEHLTAGDRGLAGRLTVEITETAAIHDLDQTAAFVDALRELGCHVAIDDFGAGHTSLKNLEALNIDMLKIDGAFVKNLSNDPDGLVFIKSIVEIANAHVMVTVAECVGDDETARILRRAGITYLQGFHYGMPLTPAQLEAKLTS